MQWFVLGLVLALGLAVWLGSGFFNSLLAGAKGHDAKWWFIAGLIVPVVSTIALSGLPDMQFNEDRIRCKYCAELIYKKAIKCKHCGSDLSGG